MTEKRIWGSLPGPRPHVWKSGPDPVEHKKYLNWIQQKNQANFRKEGWELSFEVWKEIWGDKFHNKGRASEDYCMTRRDDQAAWTRDNVEILTRREHVLRQGLRRDKNWRSGPRKRKPKVPA
jgi:hypothetical protein